MKKTIIISETYEKTASNGGVYLTIETAEGRYSCWETVLFPTLKANVGIPLEVEIMTKGKYQNIVGARDMMPTQQASQAYFPRKKTEIGKAMEKKQEGIRESMSRKEDSIKIAGSQRDAVLIVVNLYPELKDAPNKERAIKDEYEKWKAYFLGDPTLE